MMNILEYIANLLLWMTLPGTVYLLVLTVSAACHQLRTRSKSTLQAAQSNLKIALLIPAHNEAAVIARTLANICPLAARDGNITVIVIADNCSDQTAKLARARHVAVYERVNDTQRGKGFALDEAFKSFPDFDAYIVVDADSMIADNFFPEIRQAFLSGAQVLQVSYQVLNGSANTRTGLAEIALAGFNVLRPLGRAGLGLSAGILGNGFALTQAVLQAVPYDAQSLVEDWEYHLRLVKAGFTVQFVASTEVRGEMPTGKQGQASQQARWQGGRLRMLREHGLNLGQQILNGRLVLLELLLDLCLLPLAYHVLLLLLAFMTGQSLLLVFSWLVLLLHFMVIFYVAKLPIQRACLLLYIPFYLLFKLRILGQTIANATRHSAWVRTNRHGG